MKLIKPPKLEIYSFLISMPLIDIAWNLILYKDRFFTDSRVWSISFPLIFVIGIASWLMHVQYTNSIEQRFPGLDQTNRRITWKVMVFLFVMTPSVLLIFVIYDYFGILGYQLRRSDIPKGLFLGLAVNMIFETLYEADYIFTKLKESAVEKETMQDLSLQSEFDALKNQVNPHFLFNCFNTLSSLISVDRPKAEQFLAELSKVYRYLLRNNEDGMSTVETELKFIQSYFQLLQTRHGDAIQLNIEVDKRHYPYQLPSLTLQLLVENVVKHNVLSRNKPLVIDIISTTGNTLVVNNNLQRRPIKALSNRVGLENIRARYALLRQTGFQVIENEKNFTVVLPLIWKPVVVSSISS